jgi:hypothetical protein
VSLVSRRSQIVTGACIKPLRDVLLWLLPLFWVLMKIRKIYGELLILKEISASNFNLISDDQERRDAGRGVDAQCLCDAVTKIGAVVQHLILDKYLLPFLFTKPQGLFERLVFFQQSCSQSLSLFSVYLDR